MKLSEIQPKIVELLQASAELAGVTIVVDDGSYPKMEAIDRALSIGPDDSELDKKGLCLVVYRVEHQEAIGHSDDVFADTVLCSVIIEEVATVNRGEYGTGIAAEDAIEMVMRAVLSGRPVDPYVTRTLFQPGDPPWSPVQVVNGRRKAIVDFVTHHEISIPTPS